MDFPLYFKSVSSKLPKVFSEIDHGCFRLCGPYFIRKSPCTTFKLTFEFWSIIVRPYWRALIWGGELCVVPVGPVGDLDLGVVYWKSVPFMGTGDRFRRMTFAVWLRGSLVVLESVRCYVCEVLGIS